MSIYFKKSNNVFLHLLNCAGKIENISVIMHQGSNLPPNPGPFNPAGGSSFTGKPPITHGIPGLPVALGGVPPTPLTAGAVRPPAPPNGIHPSQTLALPTPPPLVSVPLSIPSVTTLPPPPLPHPMMPASHRMTAAVTTVTNSRPPHISSVGTPPGAIAPLGPGGAASSLLGPPSGLVSGLHRGRPLSPTTDRDGRSPPSPKRPRSRSRSPLTVQDDGADSDVDVSQSPEPEATILDQECYRSRNAM